MPDSSGIDIARFIRSQSDVPILMLTSEGRVDKRAAGLGAGADDYLTKPFAAEELCARIRSLFRRSNLKSAKTEDPDTLRTAHWRLDRQKLSIISDSKPDIVLTEREFMILSTLMQRSGSVVTRDELQRQVAGREWNADDRSLDVHVSRLRKKLVDICESDAPIQTVRGRGFRFIPD